jgi:hypothetical protein
MNVDGHITISIHNSISLNISCYLTVHNFHNHNFFIFFNHFLVRYLKNVPLVLDLAISNENEREREIFYYKIQKMPIYEISSSSSLSKPHCSLKKRFSSENSHDKAKDDSVRGISSECVCVLVKRKINVD